MVIVHDFDFDFMNAIIHVFLLCDCICFKKLLRLIYFSIYFEIGHILHLAFSLLHVT